MVKTIKVTDAIKSFSDVIARVYYKGETFDLQKGKNIVARLSPAKSKATITIGDLQKLLQKPFDLDDRDIEDFNIALHDLRSLKTSNGENKWKQ